MSNDLSEGGRAEVAFSFFSGTAGVSPANDAGEATLAIRLKSVRGAYEEMGTVDGQPVQIVRIEKSPVAGYTRIVVRITSPAD